MVYDFMGPTIESEGTVLGFAENLVLVIIVYRS